MRKKIIIIAGLSLVIALSAYKFFKSLDARIIFNPKYQERHQAYIDKIPDDLSFAGEPVEFNGPESYRKFYREQYFNTRRNSSTRQLFKNVRHWLPHIAQVLKDNGLPEDLKYVAVAESNLLNNSVSPRGAAGFWQLQEQTAIEFGLEINDEVDERYHPIKATKAAARYFKQAHRQFGNWTSAAASYNRGIKGLQKAFRAQSVNSYYQLALNSETSRYLYKILAIKDLIANPHRYGMHVRRNHFEINKVRVDSSIADLSSFAMQRGLSYEVLREYNPWIKKNTLTVKQKGRYYVLLLPDAATLPKETETIAVTDSIISSLKEEEKVVPESPWPDPPVRINSF